MYGTVRNRTKMRKWQENAWKLQEKNVRKSTQEFCACSFNFAHFLPRACRWTCRQSTQIQFGFDFSPAKIPGFSGRKKAHATGKRLAGDLHFRSTVGSETIETAWMPSPNPACKNLWTLCEKTMRTSGETLETGFFAEKMIYFLREAHFDVVIFMVNLKMHIPQ